MSTDSAVGVKEAQTNNVRISAEDFSPELVDCVISFLYSGVQCGKHSCLVGDGPIYERADPT
jgi:hypothetical protein